MAKNGVAPAETESPTITPELQKLLEESVETLIKGARETFGRIITEAEERLNGQLANLVTNYQCAKLIEDSRTELLDIISEIPAQITSQFSAVEVGIPSEPQLDPDWLEGLTFRSNKEIDTDDGRRFVPEERDLTPADVLSWGNDGDTVVLVAADGQKHLVSAQ